MCAFSSFCLMVTIDIHKQKSNKIWFGDWRCKRPQTYTPTEVKVFCFLVCGNEIYGNESFVYSLANTTVRLFNDVNMFNPCLLKPLNDFALANGIVHGIPKSSMVDLGRPS